jgi:thioredoxin reductase (NADPH)
MLDTIIIGSGPAGLGAAIYAKRANLDVLVVEKEYEGTGQVAESGRVDNYLGLPGVNGYDLGETFRNHALSFGVEFLELEVTGIHRQEDGNWEVAFEDGSSKSAKTVIYAAGASHRHLNIPGEETFAGKGVSYCAICDGSFYKGKKVAVIGGGDTALDDALYLSEICETVYLVHRRDEFRGAQQTVEKIKTKSNIVLKLSCVPKEIVGEKKVSGLVLADSSAASDGRASSDSSVPSDVRTSSDGNPLAVDGVFVAVGTVPKTEILKGVVPLDVQGYVPADETGSTEVPGFYVAGDARAKKLRQVITAVADGANAATEAAEYVRRG